MADYLEEDEVVDRIRAWWRENGASLVGGLVLIVGGWGGWNWYSGYADEQASESFAQFSDYVTLRESGEGDSEQADALLARLDTDYAGSGGHVLSLLYRAADAMRDEDMTMAIGHLQAALEASAGEHVEGLVRLRLARVYLQQEALDAALNTLEDIDDPGFLAAREELRGDVLLALGRGADARAAYQVALEAEASATPGMAWPFLSMKRHGLSFETGQEALDVGLDANSDADLDADLDTDTDTNSDFDPDSDDSGLLVEDDEQGAEAR